MSVDKYYENIRLILGRYGESLSNNDLANIDLASTLSEYGTHELKKEMIRFRGARHFMDYESMFLHRNIIIAMLGLVTPRDMIVGLDEKK